MNGVFNLTWDQIIKFDPINVSTLIISVVVALATVYVTFKLNQRRDFNKSRDGLITEINRNFILSNGLPKNLDEIIKDYSLDSDKGEVPKIIGFTQEYFAYNYFTQQGYFLQLPKEIRIKIENYYITSKLLLDLYNQDIRYVDDIKNCDPNRRADFVKSRLKQSLLLIQSKLNHYKELYDDLIDEMIKMEWLPKKMT